MTDTSNRVIKVLYAEDVEDVRKLMPLLNLWRENVFSSKVPGLPHFEVFLARDGEEGVTMAHDLSWSPDGNGREDFAGQQPDLILMDIRMPNKDGLTAAKELKADPQTAHIPIIVLTAFGEEVPNVTPLVESGDVELVLMKPWDWNVLFAKVLWYGGYPELSARVTQVVQEQEAIEAKILAS
jgi:CheY-like chemotaxis protein